jgi:hypothetical protein
MHKRSEDMLQIPYENFKRKQKGLELDNSVAPLQSRFRATALSDPSPRLQHLFEQVYEHENSSISREELLKR